MNATEKRLARLQSQRHSSPDYSSATALLLASVAVADKKVAFHIAGYKNRAFFALHCGELAQAIFYTQIVLYMKRIQKMIAKPFVMPAKTDYIMPPNAKYDAACDRADRLNDSIKLGEIA